MTQRWAGGLAGVAMVLAAGCVHRVGPPTVIASTPQWPVKSTDFVDLAPGGTVREVTPIFADGGYVAKGIEKQQGLTITLDGTGFQGYETALYTLTPRKDGGVKVALTSVAQTVDDKTTLLTKPRVRLFQYPGYVRFVRLLYLIRVSEADHNMAILASDDVIRLNDLTKRVQASEASCVHLGRDFCSWVPQGIAVTPPAEAGPGGARPRDAKR